MEWRSREVLAWTTGDGPGRPPRGPAPVLTGSLAVSLGVAHVAMLVNDTLCPEHRGWVFGLATVALVAAVVAIVGLLRGTATSAVWTVVAAGCGVAIGVIDASHVPGRGQLIALVFSVLALLGAALGAWQLRLWRWERRTVADLAPLPTGTARTTDDAAPAGDGTAGSRTAVPDHGSAVRDRASGPG